MRVILTEKPSVAKDIANALGAAKSERGYFKLPNGDYVTYAIGHLVESDDAAITPQENGRTKYWNFEDLPIFPKQFVYKVSSQDYAAAQFKVVSKLISSANEVVIATDAGREGELIARHILAKSGFRGSVKRLWTSKALTPDVVRDEMRKLRPGSEFESLYFAGLARDQADWLVGINLTRAVTLKSHHKMTWTVGRVQTPTLSLIVNRDLERQDFRPVPYAVVKASFAKGPVSYDGTLLVRAVTQEDKEGDDTASRLSRERAEEIVGKLSPIPTGTIAEVKKEDRREPPPLLHSLTSLQREANSVYGYSAQETLNLTQSLYENHKAVSYPRTDAQHMSPSNKDLAKECLRKLGKQNLTIVVDKMGKRVFDDAKLTDHHAIIPFNKLPSSASREEANVYNLIYRKFVGAFMPDHLYIKTSILTDVSGLKFLTTGKEVKQAGWRALYTGDKAAGEEQQLPSLAKGEKVNKTKVWKEDKETKPPAVHTEASILKLMEKLGLGTPATRASILERLKTTGYVVRDKKALTSTPKGRELIKCIKSGITSPEMTARWEQLLGEIYTKKQGKQGYEGFLAGIRTFLSKEVTQIKGMQAIGMSLPPPAPKKPFSSSSGGSGKRPGGFGSKSRTGFKKKSYSSYPKR